MFDEIRLKLCDIQGRMFELSGKQNFSSEYFIQTFMESKVAEGLDQKYNRMQWAGEEYLLEELEATTNIKKGGEIYEGEVLYWIGYIYRYWSILEKESSKEILKQASPKTMHINYFMFHTMDPEMAIEDLKEIERQKKVMK